MGSYKTWPDWMPKPLQNGFALETEDRRTTSSTEVGSVIRVEFDTDVQVATVSMTLDQLEAAFLEKFERDILTQGSEWFYFPIWYNGEVVYELCQFKDRPKIAGVIALYTKYTFTLYVDRRSDLMPDCLTEALMEYSPYEFYMTDLRLNEAFTIMSNLVGIYDAVAV